jgi:hypothetical protein
MKLRAGLLCLALIASCALLVKPTQGQSATNPVQCALSSVTTVCTVTLAGNFQAGSSYSCTVDTSGTWSGQLDFNVVGLETAAPGAAIPANGGNQISNTTSNGYWTLGVINASQFQVLVDTPGSFTGTANVGIRCAVGTFMTSAAKSASGGGSVSIISPVDGSGFVEVNCETGCGTPAPCATPTCQQVVWPGITPWPVNTINPSLPAPQTTWPVTTPAPCATPTCNQVVWQGTSPWVVGQTTGTNLHVVTDNASPIPGLTPIPFPTGTTSPLSAAGFTSNTGTPVMPTACNGAPIPINISTATTTLLGANSAGAKWHVCFISVYIVSGTLPSFFFETGGTGSCTSPTALTGTYGGIASAVGELFQFGTGIGQVMQTTGANSSWCIVSGGTTPNIQGYAEAAQY